MIHTKIPANIKQEDRVSADGDGSTTGEWLLDMVEESTANEALASEYDQRYSDHPQIWEETFHDDFTIDLITAFASISGRPPSGDLIDIGCGSGHTLKRIDERYPGRLRLTGVDLSGEAIRLATERLPGALFMVADLQALSLEAKYDLMVCLGVAEHFTNPCAVLSQLRSTLRPRGFFFLEVPNCISYGWSGSHESFRRLAGGSRQIEWHLHRVTWERIIQEAGWHILAAPRGYKLSAEFCWFLGLEPLHEQLDLSPLQRRCTRARRRENRARRWERVGRLQMRLMDAGAVVLDAMGAKAHVKRLLRRQ